MSDVAENGRNIKMSFFQYKMVSRCPVSLFSQRERGGWYYPLGNITQSSPINPHDLIYQGLKKSLESSDFSVAKFRKLVGELSLTEEMYTSSKK